MQSDREDLYQVLCLTLIPEGHDFNCVEGGLKDILQYFENKTIVNDIITGKSNDNFVEKTQQPDDNILYVPKEWLFYRVNKCQKCAKITVI